MTYQNLIDAHYLNTNQAKDLIKSEIKIFFDENKTEEKLFHLMDKEFNDKIIEFNHKYNMTIPAQLLGTIFETSALHISVSAYLDLVGYPLELFNTLDKSNLRNLNISDEIE